MIRILMLGVAWLAFALGCIGVFVPVLPTTPLLLLATFLFARFSPRLHTWITGTKVYRKYVAPFKQAGGIPVGTKLRIVAVSYIVLAISAFMVQKPFVWGILACVAIFLAWLMAFRIPTIAPADVKAVREDGERPDSDDAELSHDAAELPRGDSGEPACDGDELTCEAGEPTCEAGERLCKEGN